MAADITIFDPDTVRPLPLEVVYDFSTGAKRIKEPAQGIMATVVNGEVLLEDGKHTGALPGRVLRNRHYTPEPRETVASTGDTCGLTNSAALPLFGRLFPLLGRQNSAVRCRSGIRLKRQSNQLLARSVLACDGPESAFFAVFPRRTAESGATMPSTGTHVLRRYAFAAAPLKRAVFSSAEWPAAIRLKAFHST